MTNDNKMAIRSGLRDGVPIAIGYFAVAFSLGIIARKADLSMPLGFISSFFTRASAGEYGVYSLLVVGTTYVEVIGISLVANLRYLLMSASLSQKFADGTSFLKRILAACCITDEVFGISIAYPGKLNTNYTYSAALISSFFWALGTVGGIFAGEILPANIVGALSVALYGMFIAIVIPPSKSDRHVALAVLASFVISGLCAIAPTISHIGAGTRTIILTILISAVAALLAPVETKQ